MKEGLSECRIGAMKVVKFVHGTRRCATLLMLGGLTILSAWISVATAAWLMLRYNRGVKSVPYSNLVWPHRWPDFQRALGDHYINDGITRLHQGDTLSGIHLLRSGLAKNPSNARGLALLAETYGQAGRPDLAGHTFAAGWRACRDDPGFLHAYFAFLTTRQANDDILRLAQDCLASPSLHDPALRRFLALQAARAAFATNQSAASEALLRDHDLVREPAGILLLALIEQSRGLHGLAFARLVDLTRRLPDYQPAWITLVEHCRLHHRPDDWETSVIAFLAATPLDAGPRLAQLRMLHQRNDTVGLERQSADFLRLFRADADALLQLASLSVEIGHPEWIDQTRVLIRSDHPHSQPLALLGVEALLASEAPAAAWDALASLPPLRPESSPSLAATDHVLRATTAFALGRNDDAHFHLNRFLSSGLVQTDALVLAAQRLAGVQAIAPARTVLRQAVQRAPDPGSTPVRILEQALGTAEPADLIRLLETYRQRRSLDRLLAQACAQPFRETHPRPEPGERIVAPFPTDAHHPAGTR